MMAPGSILLGIVMLMAFVVVAAWPWLRPVRQRPTHKGADPRLAYKALVASIRELDFDYQAGLVTEEDYRRLRDHLARRAAALLQEIDHRTTQEAELEAQIEAMVRALRTQRRQPAVKPSPMGGPLCPRCGHQGEADDRFCARCGQSLTGEVTVTS